MAVYTNDLRLKEIATGDESGTWGTSTNTNLSLVAEAFSFGTEAITTNADTHTTTIADGSTDPGRSLFLKYTGTLDSACTITIGPNTVSKLWLIENATSGSQNIIISQGSGASITIPNGQTKAIYSDGAGSGGAMVDAFAHLNVVDLTVEDDLTITDDLSVGGTLGVTGVLTANAGVVVDNITIDGTEIDLSSGDLTIDVAGDIVFDADGGDFIFRDGGTSIFQLQNSSSDFHVTSMVNNKDIVFRGNDGGSFINALTLDMSAAGAATFNDNITIGAGKHLRFSDTAYITPENNVSGAEVSTAGTFIVKTGSTPSTRFTVAADGSLSTPTLGTSNVRFGVNAGNSITSGGNNNVVVGDEAGTAITTGDANVAVGYQALSTEDAHGTAVAVGFQALNALNAGVDSYNTAVGTQAGVLVTTGVENTIMGGLAGDALTTGSFNVAIGAAALSADTLGSRNTAVGLQALAKQNFTTATDSYNTGVGFFAGVEITTGIRNTIVGGLAGDALTTGANNVALGYLALSTEDTGGRSTAVGSNALEAQATTATFPYNSAFGYGAGSSINTGNQNTALGGLAGNTVTDGSQNTLVGYAVQASAGGGTRQIVLGSNVTSGGSDTVRIGTVSASATLSLDGSDTSWAAASDERLKTEITNSSVGLSFINALRPVTYKWAAKNAIDEDLPFYDAESSDPCRGTEGKTHHGFIAQEVKAVIDANSSVKDGHNIWSEDPNGTQQLAPSALIPMLVKAIQELSAEIETLKSGG
mgnify:CR=1 FL=1